MSESTKPKVCPICGKGAERIIPSDLGCTFAQEVKGPVPQNTGVSQLDVDIDRVIGKSAEAGWKVHADRIDRKRQVLAENPGATGYDLTETPDGDFDVMPVEKRGFQNRVLDINKAAMEALKKPK